MSCGDSEDQEIAAILTKLGGGDIAKLQQWLNNKVAPGAPPTAPAPPGGPGAPPPPPIENTQFLETPNFLIKNHRNE